MVKQKNISATPSLHVTSTVTSSRAVKTRVNTIWAHSYTEDHDQKSFIGRITAITTRLQCSYTKRPCFNRRGFMLGKEGAGIVHTEELTINQIFNVEFVFIRNI